MNVPNLSTPPGPSVDTEQWTLFPLPAPPVPSAVIGLEQRDLVVASLIVRP